MSKRINESQDFGSAAKVINLPTPTAGGDAANKTYVDSLKAGLTWLPDVRVAATGNVTVASPGAAIDGVTLATGDRVLLTAQATPSQNGVYVFQGGSSALTRASDAIIAGSIVPVGPDGTANNNLLFTQTTDSPVVGTTALTWTTLGQLLQAGTGLSLSGNVLSLPTVPVALGGTGSTSASAARSSLGAVGVFEQDFGDGTATLFTITHGLGRQYVQARVYLKSSGAEEDCLVTCTSATQLTLTSEAWAAAAPAAGAYHVIVQG